MKSLIIGAGQVGTALKEVLSINYDVVIRDLDDLQVEGVKVLHICYPDHENFAENTRKYVNQYKPELTIIHSSVPVGTTSKCGDDFVYSPVRGRHPRLASEMKKFTKFVASKNPRMAEKAFIYFESTGWPTALADSSESLEFLKVLSNVHMGLEISWRQEVQKMLNHFNIPSNYYESWERSYRDGYLQTKDYNLIRSIMRPDPIGGHCILPCTEILKSQFNSPLLEFIINQNEKAKDENYANK